MSWTIGYESITIASRPVAPADPNAFNRLDNQLFSYIDLFAGCGGLSLGLRRAGGEEILAVEKSEGAARTYFANLVTNGAQPNAFAEHLALTIEGQARAGLIVAPVEEVLREFDRLELASEIDLVAGGPPCQGFSLAGKRDKHDARNRLVWEFLEFVALANPKFVIIENVVGMGRKFSLEDKHSTFADVKVALETTGQSYIANAVLINAMHYGAPQRRPRLMIIGIRKDIARRLGITRADSIWESDWDSNQRPLPPYAPRPLTREKRVVLEDAIRDLCTSGMSAPTGDYVRLLQDSDAWRLKPAAERIENHEMRNHRPDTIYRFQFAQSLVRMGVSERVLGPVVQNVLARELRRIDSWFVANPGQSVRVGAKIFSTSTALHEELLRLRNKKHSQRVLKWELPAHTVVTIPDDHVHPEEPRTFSVRELARIQGFPDAFVFEGKATTGGSDRRTSVPQYTQVGNAVSPLVGHALGNLVNKWIDQITKLDISAPDRSRTARTASRALETVVSV